MSKLEIYLWQLLNYLKSNFGKKVFWCWRWHSSHLLCLHALMLSYSDWVQILNLQPVQTVTSLTQHWLWITTAGLSASLKSQLRNIKYFFCPALVIMFFPPQRNWKIVVEHYIFQTVTKSDYTCCLFSCTSHDTVVLVHYNTKSPQMLRYYSTHTHTHLRFPQWSCNIHVLQMWNMHVIDFDCICKGWLICWWPAKWWQN